MKWLFELTALYVGWAFLDYAHGLLSDIYASNPLTLNTTVFGTIGIIAIIGAAILGTLLVQDLIGRIRAKPQGAAQQLETFLGGDELLRELERVEAWCGYFGNIASSIRDVSPMIMELDHLWTTLTELKGEYRGIWTLTRQNEVTMVADQLRKASSALGKKDLDHTKAHVDGACQNAKSLIRELKVPPSSYQRGNLS